jgi:hypothetical protein
MILAITVTLGKFLERGIFRLYLLMESGVFLELENGHAIELEK